jgi:hypothetical protein
MWPGAHASELLSSRFSGGPFTHTPYGCFEADHHPGGEARLNLGDRWLRFEFRETNNTGTLTADGLLVSLLTLKRAAYRRPGGDRTR